MKKWMLALFATAITGALGAADVDARVAELLSKMSLEEKLELTAGLDGMSTRPVERLNIPPLLMTDGPNGVRWDKTTAFPTGICMAATWNTDLVAEAATMMGKETLGKGRQVLLGPCINIARHPFGGRVFEGYGEDPHLTARLSVAWINALQAQGVGASVKHFAANNQETERMTIDTLVDERTLREIYLPAFEASVKEADPVTLMAAYNKLNGDYCSANGWLLNDVLRKEWGFKGLVVSDWGATHAGTSALVSGLDLEMPGPGSFLGSRLTADAKAGRISPEEVDRAAKVMLRALLRVGAFERSPKKDDKLVNTPGAQGVARKAATEGIVLLKNDGGLLPFEPGKLKRIAIIGPSAASARVGGGGSSQIDPPYAVSPLEGLKRVYGKSVTLLFAEGASLGDELQPVPNSALTGVQAQYFDNMAFTGEPKISRLEKGMNFDWGKDSPGRDIPKDKFSARWRAKLKSPGTGKYKLGLKGDDGYRLKLDGKPLIDNWTDHAAESKAATVDFEAGKEYLIEAEYYENAGDASLQLGWLPPQNLIEAAVAVAKSADAVLLFTGLSAAYESEGSDRRSFGLPPGQDELIKAIVAANPNTALIILSGTPVDMQPWINDVPAILQAWFPGMEGGNAIADLIAGKANPSGKLPLTFPVKLEDIEANKNFPGDATKVVYKEGLMVGYRQFDTDNIAPQFAFGHGLSYTKFGYSAMTVTKDGLGAKVNFTIKNEGTRAGAEAAQLYVRAPKSRVKRPFQELKGFKKVLLKPGESKQVTLELPERAFAYWSVLNKKWQADAREYEIRVGASSRDVRLVGNLKR